MRTLCRYEKCPRLSRGRTFGDVDAPRYCTEHEYVIREGKQLAQTLRESARADAELWEDRHER